MKSTKLLIAMLLLVSQLFTGLAQAMAEPSNAVKPSIMTEKKVLAENPHVCHHGMDKESLASAHDCCDAQASQSECAMCGDDCTCGNGCHHVLSQNMLSASQASWQILAKAISTKNTYMVAIRPVFLSQEEIPPKI